MTNNSNDININKISTNDTSIDNANTNDLNLGGTDIKDTNINDTDINDTDINDTNINNTRFEDALYELEEIVRKIESGEHSLEENLELFERGVALTRQCSLKLDAATLRIKKLVNENEIEEIKMD